MSTTREVRGEPSTLPLMLKAALPVLPGVSAIPGVRKSGDTLPQLTLTRHDVAIDREHVERYSRVCGFSLKESLPLTYPHVLAFGLHMAIMTDPSFPFPAVGTVHIGNAITAHRPIAASERLQVTCRPQSLRPHPKGRAFDLTTEVHSAGELVWEETTTLLRRGRDEPDAESGPAFADVPPSGVSWRLPADLGRRYAAVSGDHNPIHLYRLTAKAFGFPRQIVHGMWSKARCLAALEGRLPDAVTVEVAFKKPVLLPGTVALGTRRTDGGRAGRHPAGDGVRANAIASAFLACWDFSLTSPRSGAPHLLGRATPA
ncbi:MAG TPA: MaoC/PaaZ C-terminal domain-containing protein [Nocardioidaceae bacterium]|nr:MaoC/PaaZ C-terminal domain-containing protein [Nocardioidaceae bacterium]